MPSERQFSTLSVSKAVIPLSSASERHMRCSRSECAAMLAYRSAGTLLPLNGRYGPKGRWEKHDEEAERLLLHRSRFCLPLRTEGVARSWPVSAASSYGDGIRARPHAVPAAVGGAIPRKRARAGGQLRLLRYWRMPSRPCASLCTRRSGCTTGADLRRARQGAARGRAARRPAWPFAARPGASARAWTLLRGS